MIMGLYFSAIYILPNTFEEYISNFNIDQRDWIIENQKLIQ